ncbi:MAG: TetR/AcrR family transcriptional regulator [Bacteriovoracaceae bacterium]|nr:TetR/AcrR family transcriptional regulator [Bacteriovoracaceae bacterium]
MEKVDTVGPSRIDPKILELFEFKLKKGDQKRLEIIHAAIECLATIGFEMTTYESIAKLIGTRRAHVNYYFKDKSEIILSCIHYIVANYQQTSIKHIDQARLGEEMLFHYIEAPFIWAKENPEELSVMLLFYYLCNIRGEYKELHDQIRDGGVTRISYILKNGLNLKESDENINLQAKTIQNLISGSMMDAATTNLKSMRQAEEDIKKFVSQLYKIQGSHK